MVLNNLFYVTVKFGDEHAKEMEDVWAELCACWPTNLRIILRYLFIVTGMAPNELLPYVIHPLKFYNSFDATFFNEFRIFFSSSL